jgi:cardiolipin synthase C
MLHFMINLKTFSSVALIIIASLATGCSKPPNPFIGERSMAFKGYEETVIGRKINGMEMAHPGESGFTIISKSVPAYTSRIMLTELAEKSLDLQYYIWEADATGRIFADRLIRAADRGVKVRLLVDDMNLSGSDATIASLDAHPQIEIRIFNPFSHRNSRYLDFFTDLKRINHRMHNKIMIMDNTLAIVGGRNIGNHYFGVDTHANFRDLDIAAVGPVVREVSTAFDRFWNSNWSVPVKTLVDRPYTQADLENAMSVMRQKIAVNDYPYPLDEDVAELKSELETILGGLIWAPGAIIYDQPENVDGQLGDDTIDQKFYEKLATLREEILVESAYFVTRERGVEMAKKLHDRGVKIRVLTNSLVSNDVLAAHAGYAKWRVELVKNGVELYELRPDAGTIRKTGRQAIVSTESMAALHTKAIVFDRESVFIGSFNLDPRSANINTEAGLYVESPELAQQVIAFMDEGVTPENSYRVTLDEKGNLVWITESDGKEIRYGKDPGSTFWQRFMTGFIQLLPVQGQL